jgi:hypothetical protein
LDKSEATNATMKNKMIAMSLNGRLDCAPNCITPDLQSGLRFGDLKLKFSYKHLQIMTDGFDFGPDGLTPDEAVSLRLA